MYFNKGLVSTFTLTCTGGKQTKIVHKPNELIFKSVADLCPTHTEKIVTKSSTGHYLFPKFG